MKSEQFEQMVTSYLDGELVGQDAEIFKDLLATDSDCLDLFVERSLMEAELCRHGEEVAALATVVPRVARGVGQRRQWISSLAAAAAVLLIAAVVLYKTHIAGAPVFAEMRTSLHAMVSVSGGSEDGDLKRGSVVTVTQGAAEITLAEGVRCVLPAPGRLRLVDTGEVRLYEGSARFQVEPEARGFTVWTDAVRVVDLGTDFAVDLGLPDQPQVHVMKGRVEVHGLTGRKESSVVVGGNAVVLGAVGTLKPVPMDAKRFPGGLPAGVPAVYFSFDETNGDVLPAMGALAEQMGVHASLGHQHSPKVGEGRFGKGLDFQESDGYLQTNWLGIGGSQARTISLWLRLDPAAEVGPYPLLGWGRWSSEPKMSNIGLRVGNSPEGAPVLRVVSGGRWLQGTTPLNDGNWHHVVVCMGAYSKRAWPETSIFVDGRVEQWTARVPWPGMIAPIDTFFTETNSYSSEPFVMGQFGDPTQRTLLPSFQGGLDEVIVAAGVLTVEQVTALYEGRLDESGLDLGR